MTILMDLEDFGVITSPHPTTITEAALEEARVEAFENGYRAGWDDATKTAENEQRKISAEFAQSLQDLSFTYHEARSHIMGALQPVFHAMTAKVLPDIASQTLLPHIVDQILNAAQSPSETPMEIRTHPNNLMQLESLIPQDCTLPTRLTPDASLSNGQAFLTHNNTAQQIDMDHTITAIRQLVDNFFQLSQKELGNDRTEHTSF
ncbi:hypothetical protein [Parasulfitobacter algicola]|uniref:Flagellar assembly protein FliH n=1 Tax=Parasulfitobacter algicola TaxID=2614809 RepID=A0ABX2IP43_9RHOB|nr:hypothetical protein [Sulfitobacter algicola]NSX54659.1 hypothetical protein [Sulfitobacter algicola]